MNIYEIYIIYFKCLCLCGLKAHSSVERATLLASVSCTKLKTDGNNSVRGETLQKQIDEDRSNGLIPFYIVATLGTTSICSYDNLLEIGPICRL